MYITTSKTQTTDYIMAQSKILITGALGFLGNCFVRILSYGKSKYSFAGIDKANNVSSLHNAYVSDKFRFHIGDITDKHCLDRIFTLEKPDYVIHTASISEHNAEPKVETSQLLENNIIGTQNVIDVCIKHQVKRLVFISNEDVYYGADNTKGPMLETTNLNPITIDGIIKLSQELLIKAAGNISGLNYNIIRPCSIYGYRQPANQFIPKVIGCIMNKRNIFLNGSGGVIREWIYITDVCNGIVKLMESKECNDIWNITANQDISNIELIQKICNLMGGGWDLVKDEVLYKDANEQASISMSADKIKGLGWTRNISIPDGLANTIQWYQRNAYMLK